MGKGARRVGRIMGATQRREGEVAATPRTRPHQQLNSQTDERRVFLAPLHSERFGYSIRSVRYHTMMTDVN